MAMPTNRVVKHFDVVKDSLACQVSGFIDFSFDAFALEQLKKAFCHCIDPAEPAQLMRLKRRLESGFSSSAPGGGR